MTNTDLFQQGPVEDPFQRRDPDEAAREIESQLHFLGRGIICGTEARGYATPQNQSPFRLVVEASEGFIPLWAPNTTLRWRFQERSLIPFMNPEAIKAAITELLAKALLAWGDDVIPVKFAHNEDLWDFEIAVRNADDCTPSGCVLASAFFPNPGRNELTIYPQMFNQSPKEREDTFKHELGHVFSLRHFFAQISESRWPVEIFGTHKRFTIMNYGDPSELTDEDRSDLKRLYQTAWSGELTAINNTPIRFVRPFHALGEIQDRLVSVGRV